MKSIARFVSFLFGPLVLPVTLTIIVLNSQLSSNQVKILLPFLLFFQVIIPYFYVIYLFVNKKIKDLDVPVRQDRYMVLLVTFFSFIFSLIAAKAYGNPLVFKLCLLTTVIIFINSLITLFWKISLHMMVNIVAVIIINYLFHWQLTYLYLIVPLVFWSRLYLKKHTFMQIFVSLVLNGVITYFFVSQTSL